MTFLLLHGLGADQHQPRALFGPVLDALAPGERVIAVDVRAHGTSALVGEPADFALDRLAREVAEQVREALATGASGTTDGSGTTDASATPFTVIGISMGAAIALRVVLDGLLPIDRAVFVRPSFDDRSLPQNLRPFPIMGQALRAVLPPGETPADVFKRTTPYSRIEHETPAGARALLAQFAAPQAAARAIRLVEIPRNRAFAADAELARVGAGGVRTLVVGARRDPIHPLPLAERWAGGLGAPLEILPARDDGQPAQTRALREAVGAWLSAAARS